MFLYLSFYRAILRRVQYCYGNSSVCLLLVISLGYFVSENPNITDLLQKGTLLNFGLNVSGIWKIRESIRIETYQAPVRDGRKSKPICMG